MCAKLINDCHFMAIKIWKQPSPFDKFFSFKQKLQEANKALVDEEETGSHADGWSPQGQRKIEARSNEDGMSGMVKCVYFASTYFTDSKLCGDTTGLKLHWEGCLITFYWTWPLLVFFLFIKTNSTLTQTWSALNP